MRLFAALLLLAAFAERKSDREIEAYLAGIERYNNVERAEGVYLRDLVRKMKAKRVLEIGTSTGYSGTWMAMGLRETGGKLITIEYDRGRHATAVATFAAVGLSGLVEARLADAVQETPKIEEPFDLAFFDAVPGDNLLYYGLVLPKMRRGGAIVTHNVKSHAGSMADFLKRIQTDPAVRTEFVTPGWQGFSVTWVK